MATSHDVARAARVSQATVSRALSGSPEISESTRLRVQTAAAQLGYRPNIVARNLVRGSSRTLAVSGLGEHGAALPMSTLKLTSYYYLDVLASVEREAAAHGYDIFFVSRQSDGPDDFVHELRTRQVAGALVIPIGSALDEQLRLLGEAEIPTVVIDARTSERRAGSVHFDSYRGMRQATGYLLHLGHRRIAFFRFRDETLAGTERYKGWADALEEAGIPADQQVVRDVGLTMEAAYQAAITLLAERRDFTAIVASSDALAFGVLRALTEYRLRVPEDVSLIGFDDIDFSAFANPPLTTVRQDGSALGQGAMGMLLALIRGEPLAANPLVLPSQLIIRASTGPPRAGTGG